MLRNLENFEKGRPAENPTRTGTPSCAACLKHLGDMELKAFQLGLRTLTGALPYGKKLQDDEIAFLYMTLPEKVRQEVTDNSVGLRHL